MDVLSEHLCQGWLEGYLLTGRHGLFNTYEAFAHVDRLHVQPARQMDLQVHTQIPWRRPIPSLNYLLTSHVWRQDHNGFTHQDPGFLDLMVSKKAEVVRIYLPPDANCLLSVTEHCLASRDHVNAIVADKQAAPRGSTSTRRGGTAPAASASGVGEQRRRRGARRGHGLRRRRADPRDPGRRSIRAERFPELKIRVVNVVDLMVLEPPASIPTARPTGTSTTCSPRTSRSSSPSTATRGSSTASPTGAPTTTTPRPRTRRRAPLPPPSTWPSPTTSTGFTSSPTSPSGCPTWRGYGADHAVAAGQARRAPALHRRHRRGPPRGARLEVGPEQMRALHPTRPNSLAFEI